MTTYYLPEFVQGTRVIVEKDGYFLIDNSKLKTGTNGLGYRNSKDLADKSEKRLARWDPV